MRFRKKPSAVIEAVQFTEAVRDASLFDGVPLPEGVRCGSYHVHRELREHYSSSFYVETLEGPLTVSLGDWIATGVKGERYPIKPDIFAATYESAETPAAGATGLQPHQQRVVAEKAELDQRLEKLHAFFLTETFEGLDAAEKDRLTAQSAAMCDYSNVLSERISAFGEQTQS